MCTTIMTFLISALAFFAISFFVEGVWKYYVPVSLILVSFWLILIKGHFKSLAEEFIRRNPEFFEDEEKEMFLSCASIFIPKIKFATLFAQTEFGSAASYAMFISLIYGVISLFFENWINLIICIFIFLFIFFYINVSFAGQPEDDIGRCIIRYSKTKKFNRKKLSEYEVSLLIDRYETILNKLHSSAEQRRH